MSPTKARDPEAVRKAHVLLRIKLPQIVSTGDLGRDEPPASRQMLPLVHMADSLGRPMDEVNSLIPWCVRLHWVKQVGPRVFPSVCRRLGGVNDANDPTI